MIWSRLLYLLALAPVVTDWMDAGHLPAHPAEYVTEVVLGSLIAVGVWVLRRETARFRSMALTDELTDLPNRRAFLVDLRREVARAQRLGTSVVLAYADVDNFKRVNDTHGHEVGDRVLQHVARLLRAGLRQDVDLAYRIGGDEFAVLFIGSELETCLAAMARATPPETAAGVPRVSLSVGAVQLTDEENVDQFVARADHSMYRAKHRETGGSWSLLHMAT